MRVVTVMIRCGVLAVLLVSTSVSAKEPSSKSIEDTVIVSSGVEYMQIREAAVFKVLLSEKNVKNTPVEIAELTIRPGQPSKGHSHQASEYFYILSGKIRHVVNGKSVIIGPGDLAIIPANQEVEHHVISTEPVRALAIWAPAGELGRVEKYSTVSPLDQVPSLLVEMLDEK